MMRSCFLASSKRACEGLGEAFKVFIGHAGLGFDHRYCPNGPFGVRRITLRPAKPHGCNRYRDADNENKEFVHIGVFCGFVVYCFLPHKDFRNLPANSRKS